MIHIIPGIIHDPVASCIALRCKMALAKACEDGCENIFSMNSLQSVLFLVIFIVKKKPSSSDKTRQLKCYFSIHATLFSSSHYVQACLFSWSSFFGLQCFFLRAACCICFMLLSQLKGHDWFLSLKTNWKHLVWRYSRSVSKISDFKRSYLFSMIPT